MAPYRGNYKNNTINSIANGLNKEELLEKYLKEFRVDQCPLFLQHKCQQHRPFTCFNWHFQNQRRRRPVRRRDGTFNYSADTYCSKYDETTGICTDGDECPYLHRTAGDTERRYHLKYYKTGMCVHDTDNRGYCVKNGPHCAFAHGGNDLRPAVYDIRELQAIENGEADGLTGPNSLDKERSLLNDDPKWLDTTYVLSNYKTEPCKKPPRLCRQGYACPQFHNGKDKRRSPKKYKYRSTPCPQVKSGDEWGDPVGCDAGDSCQYCHTRTEQQFHPEIYKSTKCNDIQNTSYCPRGPFCAFAHVEQETVSLESPPPHESGLNAAAMADLMSRVMPTDNNGDVVNCHPALSNATSNDLHSADLSSFPSRAPGAPLRNGSITPPFEENGVASPIEDMERRVKALAQANNNGSSINGGGLSSSMDNNNPHSSSSNSSSSSSNNGIFKNRFLSGDQALLRQQQQQHMQQQQQQQNMFANGMSYSSMAQLAEQKRKMMMEAAQQQQQHQNNGFSNGGGGGMFFTESLDSIGNTLDDLSLDPFDQSDKTRKPSGFSDPSGNKSRQCSGFEQQQNNGTKSRNCSGNSITLVSAAMLNSNNGSNPVMIPGSSPCSGKRSPPGLGQQQQQQQVPTSDATILGVNQLGLFDLTSTGSSSNSSNGSSSGGGSPKTTASLSSKDLEIARLREELTLARQQQQNFDKRMHQAKQMCEAWKKETAISTKKVEMALNEKSAAMARLVQAEKELELGGGPYLHAIKRVAELKHLPAEMLKSLEWQLKKDLQELIKAQQLQHEGINNQWMSNNNRRFNDFSSSNMGGNHGGSGGLDWSLGHISTQQHLYGSLAQQ